MCNCNDYNFRSISNCNYNHYNIYYSNCNCNDHILNVISTSLQPNSNSPASPRSILKGGRTYGEERATQPIHRQQSPQVAGCGVGLAKGMWATDNLWCLWSPPETHASHCQSPPHGQSPLHVSQSPPFSPHMALNLPLTYRSQSSPPPSHMALNLSPHHIWLSISPLPPHIWLSISHKYMALNLPPSHPHMALKLTYASLMSQFHLRLFSLVSQSLPSLIYILLPLNLPSPTLASLNLPPP